MFDEIDRLRSFPDLARLLAHYAAAGSADREAWQDRPTDLAGLSAQDLVNLHGELLAYGWIEQNTGVVTASRGGGVARCYRVTPAGLRVDKRARAGRVADDDPAEAA